MTELQRHSILSDEATLSDDLGRVGFVETLTQVVLEAETPLVVALYGPWGSGKTSMMKQLQQALMQSGGSSPRQVETVWFVPWEHSRDDQPGVSLLLAIRRDLGLEGESVRRAMRAVALAIMDDVQVPYLGLSLGRVRANYRQLAEQDVERRSQQSLLRNHFRDVIDAARKGSDGRLKKLVIFIDDLDRCQPATAIAMLETLKLYLNFDGCIVILGIDREPIEAAIAHEYEGLGIAKESYLDKIVQLPFTIPALDKDRVDSYIEMRLPAHLRNCQQMLSLAAPDNPRQLKRTINTLLLLDRMAAISFPARDSRILCAVALMQNSAPDLYQHLRRTPKDWSLVAPAGIDSQEPTTKPDWLNKMLSGNEAREALSATLLFLKGLLDHSSAGVIDIQRYIGLSEHVGIPPSTVEPETPRQAEAPGGPEKLEGGRGITDRIGEAIPRYQRLLDDRRQELGADHADTLDAQINLANAYQAAGQIDEAIALYRDALERMSRVLGNDDPQTLVALSNLANAYQAVGQIDEAIALYQEALERMRQVLGNDDPQTLVALSNLAGAYQAAGQIDEAIDLYQEALERMRQVLGSEHFTTIITLSNLANAYQGKGRIDEAIYLYHQALEQMRPLFGADHPTTLFTEKNLAGAYRDEHRANEAIALYRDALERMRRVLGNNDPTTLEVQKELAAVLRDVERREEAGTE